MAVVAKVVVSPSKLRVMGVVLIPHGV